MAVLRGQADTPEKRRTCAACVRLWKEYEAATAEHIRLIGKQRMAHLQDDRKRAAEVQEMADEADQEREALRAAIRSHEAEAHGIREPAPAAADRRKLTRAK